MILVTGGTGLVGSHLLWHLLQRGDEVRAIYREGSDTGRVKEVFTFYNNAFADIDALAGGGASADDGPFSGKGDLAGGGASADDDTPAENNTFADEKVSADGGALAEDKAFADKGASDAGPFADIDAEELFNRINWIQADMLDPLSLEDAMEGVSRVYNCAAIVSFNPKERKQVIRNNVESTARLVDLCIDREVEKLCHVSSVSALGNRREGKPVTEEDSWKHSKNRTGYSVSKFYSELEVWRGIGEGLNAVIVNPTVILGPGNWDRGSAKFFTTIQKGMKYYTEGMTGFVDVRDVCRCMMALMDSDISGDRFIINSEDLYYRDLFNMIADALGKPRPETLATRTMTEIGWRLEWLRSTLTFTTPLLTRETARSGRSISRFSNSKIKEALGYGFIPIAETVSWTASKLPPGN